jgi:hypothetical protein
MTAIQGTTRFGPLSLHNVALPDHLVIRPTQGNLLTDFNTFGYDGELFFGTAFIQGKRLQFTTAMPLSTMLKVSQIDRASAGENVHHVLEHANRPRVPAHAKSLRRYFLETACKNEKFVLPAFAFNFGDEVSTPEDAPDAVLIIYARENDVSANAWPALLQLPNAIKLDTTDGAHRGGEIDGILKDNNLSADQKECLRRNAVDVKIIFERKRVDAHQDFADCAKAKPITASLIATFDVRESRNARALQLVKNVPFLTHYVDATASNINLSAGSAKIWSMSAVGGFVNHVQGHYPPPPSTTGDLVQISLEEKLNGAEVFFAELIKHVPDLNVLEASRLNPAEDAPTPATFRKKRGGHIALRGVGMSFFARGFVHAKDHGMEYADVAERLGRVDWHVLDCERSELPSSETEDGRLEFANKVRQHANPLWGSMLITGEARYRIGSTNDECDVAWARVLGQYFTHAQAQAAE